VVRLCSFVAHLHKALKQTNPNLAPHLTLVLYHINVTRIPQDEPEDKIFDPVQKVSDIFGAKDPAEGKFHILVQPPQNVQSFWVTLLRLRFIRKLYSNDFGSSILQMAYGCCTRIDPRFSQ
jgi:hypothetical protein